MAEFLTSLANQYSVTGGHRFLMSVTMFERAGTGPKNCLKMSLIYLLFLNTILIVNHNYNKLVKSDWLSTALISALSGLFNRTVRVMPK